MSVWFLWDDCVVADGPGNDYGARVPMTPGLAGDASVNGAGERSRVEHGPPLWPCLCGARNRLRDTTCRSCGAGKP